MAHTAPIPQPIDHFILQHNAELESRCEVLKYYNSEIKCGSLYGAMGPPIRRLKQVSQDLYQPRRRGFQARLPISFCVAGAKGIRLIDARNKKTEALDGATDRLILSTQSQKVQIRLLVHGQTLFTKPIYARRVSRAAEPHERRYIAYMIAQAVEMALRRDGGEWRLDCWAIRFSDLRLLELQHVSEGSWQPVLAYSDPEPNGGACYSRR